MQLSFIIELAFRNLIFRRLRTVLTLAGVGIAISFAVFLLSIGYGLQIISLDEIVNARAVRAIDVTSAKTESGFITGQQADDFESLNNVEAVYPQISLGASLNYGDSSIDAVIYGKDAGLLRVEGVVPIAGRLYGSGNSNEAVLNTTVIEQLGIKNASAAIGETVAVKQAGGNANASIAATDKWEYLVVGVVEGKRTAFAYVPRASLEQSGSAGYDRVKVLAKNQESVAPLQIAIEELGFNTASARETVEEANVMFNIFKVILLFFGSIAVIVAFLGMFNTLTISLLEKTREIGMMRALGATHSDVQRLFLTEALMIGVLGGVSGVVLSLITGFAVNGVVAILARSTGNEPSVIFYSPVLLVIAMFLIATISSFLTGLYPARRAANTKILDALRYE